MIQKNRREEGSVLVFALVLSSLAFAYAGGIVMMNLANARVVQERAEQRIAFYLAEAGLEDGKHEVFKQADLQGDGLGTTNATFEIGGYEVTATDLGGGNYQLTSTGTSKGNIGVILQQVVTVQYQSIFPDAAMTLVGGFDKDKLKFDKHAGIIIDGGEAASALSFSDEDLYDEFTEEIKHKLEKGELDKSQFTGQKSENWQLKHGNEVEVAIDLTDNVDEELAELFSFYDDLKIGVDKIAESASEVGEVLGKGDDVFTYGSAENPAVVHFTDKVELKDHDSISGHGTLIISSELKIKDDSTLNWVGDVIIIADEKKKGKLEIDHIFNVDGNVIVIGEGKEDVELKIKDDANAEINGSLFVGTSHSPDKAKKAKMEVDGKLTVNGMTTVMGSKVEFKIKEDSDFVVNGALQIGVADAPGNSELKMEFKGDMEIHYDPEKINQSGQELQRLGVELGNAGIVQEVFDHSFESQFWGQVFDKGQIIDGS